MPGGEDEAFRKALLEKTTRIAIAENDSDPGHNFLIGLAYYDRKWDSSQNSGELQ